MASPVRNHQDRAIIATADDAVLAKLATVKAGYYKDPYIEQLSQHASGIAEARGGGRGRSQRQVQPIIKRGTHARVCCMDRTIAAFVDYHSSSSSSSHSSHKKETVVQVVVLGCGKDTSYFRHGRPHVRWYEVDHPSVLQAKAAILQTAPDLFLSHIGKTEYGYSISTKHRHTKGDDDTSKSGDNTTITTNECHLVEFDLRESPQKLLDALVLQTKSFDAQAPTLFLFECVLMYMPDDASRALLQCLTQQPNLPQSYVCCYEPILGSDSFGKMMEQNLVHAGVGQLDSCLRRTRTLEAHLDKLIRCGFSHAVGCDMAQAYESVVTQAQRTQANRCEFLDELEEWLMIMRHYCFVVATTAPESDFAKHFCSVGSASALGFTKGKCTTKTK